MPLPQTLVGGAEEGNGLVAKLEDARRSGRRGRKTVLVQVESRLLKQQCRRYWPIAYWSVLTRRHCLLIEIVPSQDTIRTMIVSLPTKNDVFFSTSEAAEYLGFAEDTVRRYVYRNLINADKIGNSLVIRKSECDRYSKEKRKPGKPKKS